MLHKNPDLKKGKFFTLSTQEIAKFTALSLLEQAKSPLHFNFAEGAEPILISKFKKKHLSMDTILLTAFTFKYDTDSTTEKVGEEGQKQSLKTTTKHKIQLLNEFQIEIGEKETDEDCFKCNYGLLASAKEVLDYTFIATEPIKEEAADPVNN